ncbi:MAG TPA: cytochrome c [Prolixibacteraceae bacterium]|nr:cytochrome c [Prolixibacteraceae bacterium]
MKGIIKTLVLSAFVVVMISACTGNREKKAEVENINSMPPTKQTNNNQQKSDAPEHPGKAVFTKYCLACHQADGSGVPGMYPPLGEGSWASKDPKELIAVMMKGLNGKIEVNGETFNGFMPSQAQLTDEEIADVLSYVRSSFGNNFDPVDANLVKKVRSGR